MCQIAGYVAILADNRILFGRHYPNGNAAVEYIYGKEGTFVRLDSLTYTYNYYSYRATDKHPYNLTELLNESVSLPHTCRDADGHLLFDLDGCEESVARPPLDSFAFCEHTGKGAHGLRGTPFLNFWYNDNTFARNMATAYGKPEPRGLYPYPGFNRWSVLGDSLRHYQPYNAATLDWVSLDGMYYYRTGNFDLAYLKWKCFIDSCVLAYDATNQRFMYNLPDNYLLGLAAILSACLMDCTYLTSDRRHTIVQHYISLRSCILSKQLSENGALTGWPSGGNPNDLINTETVAANVLGLSAGADLTFEAGKLPLQYTEESRFFVREHNVISASVENGSKAGFLCQGPNWTFEGGRKYVVEFFLRARSAQNCDAEISVYDSTNGVVLASSRVTFFDGSPGLNWSRAELGFGLEKCVTLSFRCYWFCGSSELQNMDLACVRVKVVN